MATVKQLCFLILYQIFSFGLTGSILPAQGTDTNLARTVFREGEDPPCHIIPPCPRIQGIRASSIECDVYYGVDEDIWITPAECSLVLEEVSIAVFSPQNQILPVTPVQVKVYDHVTRDYIPLNLPTVIDDYFYNEEGKVLLYIRYGVKFCESENSPSDPTEGTAFSYIQSGEGVSQGDYKFILNVSGKYELIGGNNESNSSNTEEAAISAEQIMVPMPTSGQYGSGTSTPCGDPFSFTNTEIIEVSDDWEDCFPVYDPLGGVPYEPLVPTPGTNKVSAPGQASWIETQVYPNPVTGSAILEMKLLKQEEIRFQILDLSGRVLMNQENTRFEKGQHKIKLDLKALPNGVYFIHLQTDEKSETAKFLKFE